MITMAWHGNFVTLPTDEQYGLVILSEPAHFINCIPEDGNLCVCACGDCVEKTEVYSRCICFKCECGKL